MLFLAKLLSKSLVEIYVTPYSNGLNIDGRSTLQMTKFS